MGDQVDFLIYPTNIDGGLTCQAPDTMNKADMVLTLKKLTVQQGKLQSKQIHKTLFM